MRVSKVLQHALITIRKAVMSFVDDYGVKIVAAELFESFFSL